MISLKQLKAIARKELELSNALKNAFFEHEKKAAGKVTPQVPSKHGAAQAQFFVVQEPVQATISSELAQELGLIRLVATVTKEGQLYEESQLFEATFKGLGKLRGLCTT